MNLSSIADFRKSYRRGKLEEHSASTDPRKQFEVWYSQAVRAKIPEPNAMTLATVSLAGRPSTRVVLIKGWDSRGIIWYTNYESRKGIELLRNPYASLQFHWVTLERQIRVEGKVEKISEKESDAYYHSRPLGSRIGAWASPQSKVIPNRAILEARTGSMEKKFNSHPPRPPFWGGFRMIPDCWEFWQGRENRLHDRLRYRKVKGRWVRERLAP